MKKIIITMLTGITLSTGFGTAASFTNIQSAHASLIYKLVGITYLYKNRALLKQMFERAKSAANSEGLPKMKVGQSVGDKDQLLVVTKKGSKSIGYYPKQAVQFFTRSKNDVKKDLQKLGF